MKRSAAFLLLFLTATASAADKMHWVGTWAASPAPQLADEAQMRSAKLVFEDQTLREIVHASIGGKTVRLRLSNAFGKEAAEMGAVHVALRGKGSAIVAGSDRPVTFGGRTTVEIPANALVLSDPVQLEFPAAGDLAVSIFLPKKTLGAGVHYSSQQTSYLASGNATAAAAMNGAATVTSWAFLTSVEVLAPEATGAVVAFGDSITDGARSTVDANHRWPDILAARLLALKGGRKLGVMDAGIGGNRILHDAQGNVRFGVSALARFDRDVLSRPA